MTRRYHSSVAVATTIPGGTTNVATSIVIAAATGLPASYPYTMIIDDDTTTMEAVEVTNRSGTTLTVTRGVDGTTAQSHAAGATIHHGWSARDLDEPNAWINAGHDHSTTALGGAVPQASVTSLVSDLAAKLTTPPAWTAWTPALTAATTNPTLGAGATATGYYAQTGKIVHLRGYIVFGGAGVNAGSGAYYISLPVSAALGGAHGGNVLVTDASATGSWLGMMVMNDASKCFINFANRTDGNNTVSHNAPFAWTTSDSIRFDLTYEAA